MTTAGYGDIVPRTLWEQLYTIFAMVIGATMFAYVVGNLTILTQHLNLRSAYQKEHMSELKNFLNEQKLPKKLRVRRSHTRHRLRFALPCPLVSLLALTPNHLRGVPQLTANRYLESYITQTSAFPQARIKMLLPLYLRTRLQMHIYHLQCPKGLSFFNGKDPSLIAALTSRCDVQIFEPGEALCREGDAGNKVRAGAQRHSLALSLSLSLSLSQCAAPPPPLP